MTISPDSDRASQALAALDSLAEFKVGDSVLVDHSIKGTILSIDSYHSVICLIELERQTNRYRHGFYQAYRICHYQPLA